MNPYLLIFVNRRMLLMLLLGFSSGTPLHVIGGTLQAWMTDAHVDIKQVGLFSLVGLPYAWKFVWAPALDTFNPRLRFISFGLRRKWMLLTQLTLMLSVSALGFSKPEVNLTEVAFIAVLVAFFAASQDIVVDAYRTDFLREDERGPGSAVFVLGYRLALLGGSVSLILADHIAWFTVYQILALTLGIGIIATFLAPEPEIIPHQNNNVWLTARDALADFFRKPGAILILAFVLLYKLPDVMAAALTTRFMMDIGFAKSQIGYITKTVGLGATIGGAFLGGALIPKLGAFRSLFYFGVLQALSVLAFALLAAGGNSLALMAGCVGVENLCNGMGTAAFMAFMMSLCNKPFTATQYALLTSIMAVTRYLGGAFTGYMVEAVGWITFFVVCALSATPGLLLIGVVSRKENRV